MRDLDIARDYLKKNDRTFVVAKEGRIVHETDSPGILGLLTAVEKLGKESRDSSLADKIVGEAAAQLCVYSGIMGVFAVTLSEGGKRVLENNKIPCEYESLVPHILNRTKTDFCPFEKLVAGCNSPEEAYMKLKLKVKRA
jgi:hypothetical protein